MEKVKTKLLRQENLFVHSYQGHFLPLLFRESVEGREGGEVGGGERERNIDVRKTYLLAASHTCTNGGRE